MRASRRGAAALVALGAGVVFLGIEVVEAVLTSGHLSGPVRFAALHSVGVVAFGILSLLAVIAAVVLSPRWLIVMIAVCIAAAAVAVYVT